MAEATTASADSSADREVEGKAPEGQAAEGQAAEGQAAESPEGGEDAQANSATEEMAKVDIKEAKE